VNRRVGEAPRAIACRERPHLGVVSLPAPTGVSRWPEYAWVLFSAVECLEGACYLSDAFETYTQHGTVDAPADAPRDPKTHTNAIENDGNQAAGRLQSGVGARPTAHPPN